MIRLHKIFVYIFVVIAVIFFGLYLFVQLQGKTILKARLEEAFNRNVEVGNVRFIFPLGVRVDDLNVEGLVQAKEARVQAGLPIFLKRGYIVSSLTLIEPFVALKRTEDEKITLADSEGDRSSSEKKTAQKKKELSKELSVDKKSVESNEKDCIGIVVDHLSIQNGTVQFLDPSLDDSEIILKEISLKAQSVAYPPKPLKTKYNFSGTIFNENKPFSGCQVQSKGWINFSSKDMDSDLKIIEPSGVVDLSADLKAVQNDLTVAGKVNLKSMVLNKKEEEDSKSFSLDNLLMVALKSSDIKINVDFAIKTKLDAFQLGSISFSGQVGYSDSEEVGNSIQKSLKDFGKKIYEKSIQAPQEIEENKEVPSNKEIVQ